MFSTVPRLIGIRQMASMTSTLAVEMTATLHSSLSYRWYLPTNLVPGQRNGIVCCRGVCSETGLCIASSSNPSTKMANP